MGPSWGHFGLVRSPHERCWRLLGSMLPLVITLEPSWGYLGANKTKCLLYVYPMSSQFLLAAAEHGPAGRKPGPGSAKAEKDFGETCNSEFNTPCHPCFARGRRIFDWGAAAPQTPRNLHTCYSSAACNYNLAEIVATSGRIVVRVQVAGGLGGGSPPVITIIIVDTYGHCCSCMWALL